MNAKAAYIQSLLGKEFTQAQLTAQGNKLVLRLKERVVITLQVLESEILIDSNYKEFFLFRYISRSTENWKLLKDAEDRIKLIFALERLDCVMMHYFGRERE